MTSWKRWCHGATKAEELQQICKCSGQWGDHVERRKKDQTQGGGGGRGHRPRGQSNLKTLGGSCTQVPVAGGNHGKLMVLWGKQKRTGRAL